MIDQITEQDLHDCDCMTKQDVRIRSLVHTVRRQNKSIRDLKILLCTMTVLFIIAMAMYGSQRGFGEQLAKNEVVECKQQP